MNLTTITAPVSAELRQFERFFRTAMQSHTALVDTVVRYVVRRKGKRVRPALVFLGAAACGGVREATYRGAALVELLHTATLIHDDVVDEAATRRGFASINAVWKNKVAVLMGDYILARGLLLSVEAEDFEFLRIISQSVRRMSEGELLQIQKSRQLNIDEDTYFRIISDKTASLLSTCSEIGALSGGADPQVREAMRDFGEFLGIAFQIKDDLLDYLGKESTLGKPVGGDLHEKKITLPLIHAFGRASARESRSIIRLIKKDVTATDFTEILAFVRSHGGLDYAAAQADAYRARALACLDVLPDSAARQSLRDLTDFVISRSK